MMSGMVFEGVIKVDKINNSLIKVILPRSLISVKLFRLSVISFLHYRVDRQFINLPE